MKRKIIFTILLLTIFICICTISLGASQELEITSDNYTISELYSYIGGIRPKTSLEEFKKSFTTKVGGVELTPDIKIYKDEELKEEVLEGYIATNMKVDFGTFDKVYTAYVMGDINGDGLLDQLDMSYIVKHIIGAKGYNLIGNSLICADLNNDGVINQIDLKQYINYIVYGKFDIQNIVRPKPPKIEIVSGEFSQSGWYTTYPVIQIVSDEELDKLMYRVQGRTAEGQDIDTKEREITKDELKKINNDGVFTITTYAYSKDGVKSEVVTKRIQIDTTAPTITKFEANNFTQNSMNFDIEILDKSSKTKKYELRYGTQVDNLNHAIFGGYIGIDTNKEVSASIVIDSLTPGIKYYMQLIVTDYAGNIQASDIKELWTVSEAPTIDIIDEDTWTNREKRIEISKKDGYITKYTIDGSDPRISGIEYNSYFTVPHNCEIRATYINGENPLGEVATKSVTKIDRLEPQIGAEIIPTASRIEIFAHADDRTENEMFGKSGIELYRYSKDGGRNFTSWIPDSHMIFNDLYGKFEGEKYKIIVECKDRAGNINGYTRESRTIPNNDYFFSGNQLAHTEEQYGNTIIETDILLDSRSVVLANYDNRSEKLTVISTDRSTQVIKERISYSTSGSSSSTSERQIYELNRECILGGTIYYYTEIAVPRDNSSINTSIQDTTTYQDILSETFETNNIQG